VLTRLADVVIARIVRVVEARATPVDGWRRSAIRIGRARRDPPAPGPSLTVEAPPTSLARAQCSERFASLVGVPVARYGAMAYALASEWLRRLAQVAQVAQRLGESGPVLGVQALMGRRAPLRPRLAEPLVDGG
jgi:hypothetical protein